VRTIAVVTVARSDYGIYLPVLRRIVDDPALQLRLLVTGTHLSAEFGSTVEAIEADGFPIGDRIEMLLSSDTPTGTAKSMGLGTLGFADVYARNRPDILVVLGDRFEMHAAVVAALPYAIPVAHIHGGELSFGAIDDALRHSITKLSHLHFTSTEAYAQRVIQMGEEPWRVTVTGAPGLDHLHALDYMDRAALERQFNLRLDQPPVMVTFHPVTLEHGQAEAQIDAVLAALESITQPIVFSMPNADATGRAIGRRIAAYVEAHPKAFRADNFGTRAYFSLMKCAAVMLGNSSSGIIEAASFELPVVNIGSRQAGRIHGANVLDTGYARADIERAIQTALQPDFRSNLRGMQNPYGQGHAAALIVNALRDVLLDARLLIKRFHDLHGLEDQAAIAREASSLLRR
jgi:UDP-hydrolysing UDP-N-acetyl-D-glucosamine 2-epimerase